MAAILSRPQCVNSLRLSDTYMHQLTKPTLVQTMTCCLFSTKQIAELTLAYYILDPWEQISAKFESKHDDSLSRNGFEYMVCKTVSILCQPQSVKPKTLYLLMTLEDVCVYNTMVNENLGQPISIKIRWQWLSLNGRISANQNIHN